MCNMLIVISSMLSVCMLAAQSQTEFLITLNRLVTKPNDHDQDSCYSDTLHKA